VSRDATRVIWCPSVLQCGLADAEFKKVRNMKSSRGRSPGRRSAALLPAVALVGGMMATVAPAAASWPNQECPVGGDQVRVSPGISSEKFRLELNGLAQGDVMLLAPGTYDVGLLAVYACRASAEHPITLTAADPTNPPLLRGRVYFNSPSHWRISHIRFEGTVPDGPTLQLAGGDGWVVDSVEVFGANRTGAFANLVINSRDGRGPAGFTVTNSCIHDAALTRSSAGYHNIYVTASGGSSVQGTISRNLIYGNPQGAGVKLGVGGDARSTGPWNVRVERNTIVNGSFGVVFHGRVSRNVVAGNLMGNFKRLVGFGYRGKKSAAVYSHYTSGTGNRVEGNYLFKSDLVLRRIGRAEVKVARTNRKGSAPAFSGQSCSAWHPDGRAAGYGRYS